MRMFGPQEAEQMAANIDALLDELGGADEVRELHIERFRHQLDGDDQAAQDALDRVAAFGQHQRCSSLLLDIFMHALTMNNPALARAAHAGVQALVNQARSDEAQAAGEED